MIEGQRVFGRRTLIAFETIHPNATSPYVFKHDIRRYMFPHESTVSGY
ncbi:MAG TPA: hypothetical protein VKA97_12100 [Pyrinomonadaceae bacterium]|nr:hypothetical protein [Pyrinomonadaceae bacterium]